MGKSGEVDKGTAACNHSCWAVHMPVKGTKPLILAAQYLPELTSLYPSDGWWSTLLANLGTGTTESLCYLTKGCMRGWSWGQGTGDNCGGRSSPLPERKTAKKLPGFPRHPTPFPLLHWWQYLTVLP